MSGQALVDYWGSNMMQVHGGRQRQWRALLGGIVLSALVVIGFFVVGPDRLPRSRGFNCVPTPNSATAVARISTAQSYGQTPLAEGVSDMQGNATVNAVDETIDLAPDMAERDKMHVFVFRCDGTLVHYLMPGAADYTTVPLGPGDTIYDALPAASTIGNQIQVPTDTPIPTITPGPSPTSTITLTPVPYNSPTPWSYPPTALPGPSATAAPYP